MLDVTPVPNAFPGSRGRGEIPRARPPRPGPCPGGGVGVEPDLRAVGRQADAARRLHGAGPVQGPGQRDRAQAESALPVRRPRRQGRGHEAGQRPVLSADRAAAGRLHDGDRRLRRGEQSRERALLDRRTAQGRRRRPAREQPAAGRAEREVAEADRPADNPFLVGDMLLYPNLGTPLPKAQAKELAFFFTVYQAARPSRRGPGADAERQARSPSRRCRSTRPTPTAGSSRSADCPSTTLSPGTYDLRVVVTDGTSPQFAIGAW